MFTCVTYLIHKVEILDYINLSVKKMTRIDMFSQVFATFRTKVLIPLKSISQKADEIDFHEKIYVSLFNNYLSTACMYQSDFTVVLQASMIGLSIWLCCMERRLF